MYNPKAIIDWFHRTLGVNHITGNEIMTECPKCWGEKFYFNVKKQIGICHRASCNFTPTIHDLIEIVGFGPSQEGYWDRPKVEESEPQIILPGQPLMVNQNGQLMTTNIDAVKYLRSRGLSYSTILNWGLTCDGERVYIPIKDENSILVNFNSRVLPYFSHSNVKKYLYAKGAKTSKYILGWTESRNWERLSLVENTFVSLWLRSDLQCSTAFGSNISDVQADLIGRSNVRTVALLWDENAEFKAEKAIRKLHDRGVNAAFWRIKGQPDDYSKNQVISWANKVFEAAKNGDSFVDFTND